VRALLPAIYGYFGTGDIPYVTINLIYPAGMPSPTRVKEVSVTERIHQSVLNKGADLFTFSAFMQGWIQIIFFRKAVKSKPGNKDNTCLEQVVLSIYYKSYKLIKS
jgi:hypothetical protein